MCLTKKGRFKPKEEGVGYKVVEKYEDNYFTPFIYYKLKFNRWNKAKNKKPFTDDIDYGFHLYDRKYDAFKSMWNNKHTVVLKVKYKDYHVGYGDGCRSFVRVIVAKKIKPLEEISK